MQRDRRCRHRLSPYQHHRLTPPSENLPVAALEGSPGVLECEHLNMHYTGALDSTVCLEDVSEGFVSITDQRLAGKEAVWILSPKNPCLNTKLQLYAAIQGEREVYRVKWKGGGSLTVRTV
ncbi:E4 orf6/7 [Simian adenovirus 18]|uniref:E4 orf6/7 n=1 Tax=Simian adenovirus 18 TaxID=909210 RepID=H8PG13_9ADEN|nr:E4 orf6/7 [Simian adenovirus 18]AFD10579.1 E4 orf6/7 [Simian adenovirus 18]